MTLVAVAGADRGLLERWSEQVRALGHDCALVPPSGLHRALGGDAHLCLYDLGTRGAADPRELLAAVEACPQTRFVAMTARPEAAEGLRLLRAGVRGYGNRLASPRTLQALLATVGSGEIWAGRQVTDYLLSMAVSQDAPAVEEGQRLFDRLTARETEIAGQVAAGLSNKAIAVENGISERTVKAHLNSIFRKTGIHNRVQLALAVSQGENRPLQRTSA